MKPSNKTPYEIRLELLQLAFEILCRKHDAQGAELNSTRPKATTAPTTEEIIDEADKLNVFVSKGNQH
jgi:hypothetical protein